MAGLSRALSRLKLYRIIQVEFQIVAVGSIEGVAHSRPQCFSS